MTYKEQYLNRLILYSYTIKHLGLLYGRLGHILALFELSKDSKYCTQLVYYANRALSMTCCYRSFPFILYQMTMGWERWQRKAVGMRKNNMAFSLIPQMN